jgi:hypothetical protein
MILACARDQSIFIASLKGGGPAVAPVPQLDGWTEILLSSRWPGK